MQNTFADLYYDIHQSSIHFEKFRKALKRKRPYASKTLFGISQFIDQGSKKSIERSKLGLTLILLKVRENEQVILTSF